MTEHYIGKATAGERSDGRRGRIEMEGNKNLSHSTKESGLYPTGPMEEMTEKKQQDQICAPEKLSWETYRNVYWKSRTRSRM